MSQILLYWKPTGAIFDQDASSMEVQAAYKGRYNTFGEIRTGFSHPVRISKDLEHIFTEVQGFNRYLGCLTKQIYYSGEDKYRKGRYSVCLKDVGTTTLFNNRLAKKGPEVIVDPLEPESVASHTMLPILLVSCVRNLFTYN